MYDPHERPVHFCGPSAATSLMLGKSPPGTQEMFSHGRRDQQTEAVSTQHHHSASERNTQRMDPGSNRGQSHMHEAKSRETQS